MLWSSQGIFRLDGEAAPENEGYEGHARSHQQYEVLNALERKIIKNYILWIRRWKYLVL